MLPENVPSSNQQERRGNFLLKNEEGRHQKQKLNEREKKITNNSAKLTGF